ncbi:phosphatidylserine decarboxylase [Niallia sp. XMNu-256]|uniref:phosphatidylserine decarboxylase n=1 Tax=Niallia sp. XMNu-256 TaxID=3082444 RepID=UPI0030CEBAD7
MLGNIYRFFIDLLNRERVALTLARFSKSTLSKYFIPIYSRIYQINLHEMEKSIQDYESIHDFFTRKLKKGARIIDPNPFAVISPVDAVLQECGKIDAEHCITVKGKVYSIAEMLGGMDNVQDYVDGTYMIFYLSPSHYHRIHSPVTGRINKQWTLGAKSYPVNSMGLKYGKKPLAKNYRMITEVETLNGTVAIVKVGAMFINSIEKLTTEEKLTKGSEMAYFSFGSSVVLLFQAGAFIREESIVVPSEIKVGECIGYLNYNEYKNVK